MSAGGMWVAQREKSTRETAWVRFLPGSRNGQDVTLLQRRQPGRDHRAPARRALDAARASGQSRPLRHAHDPEARPRRRGGVEATREMEPWRSGELQPVGRDQLGRIDFTDGLLQRPGHMMDVGTVQGFARLPGAA